MRKVRTPEGSRYYGLPIGSPITPDAVAAAKARSGGRPEPKADKAATGGDASASSSAADPTSGFKSVKINGSDVPVEPGSKVVQSPISKKAYVVAPDETVRVVSESGSVSRLDDELSDQLLDRLVSEGVWDATPSFDDEGEETPAEPDEGSAETSSPSGDSLGPGATDSTPDDPSKPLGHGNWASNSLGHSVHARTEADIEEFRHSRITSKHLQEDGSFTPERAALHDEIIAKFLDGLPSKETPTQYMNGGGPASGKSSMTKGVNADVLKYPTARTVDELTGEFDEVEAPEALLLDADSIKIQLPEVREALERFRSGKASSEDAGWAGDSHAESSYLSERLHRAALERGHEIIFDGTGNGSESIMAARVQAAKDLGFRVEANYLFTEPLVGIERAEERARRSSRAVPTSVVQSIYSKIPPIFNAMQKAGVFDGLRLFDNNGKPGEPARLVAEGSGSEIKIHDAKAYAQFMSSSSRTDPARFSAAAQTKVASVLQTEPALTKALSEALSSSGGSIADIRTYDPETAETALRTFSIEHGLSPEEAAQEISSALSYSVTAEPENFAAVVEKALAEFRAQNMKVESVVNRFPLGGMGVGAVVVAPDGSRFEADFHTPKSLEASQGPAKDLYDMMRALPSDSPEYRFLQEQVARISQSVEAPQGLDAITDGAAS